MAAQPNADVIDLAFGEVGWSGIQTAPGAVSVGTDGILGVRSANGDVTMHASGTVTGADTALAWTGQFDRLVFTTSAERGRFTFRGTSGTEHVKVDAPTTYDRDVALRGGKDSYESNTLGGKATRIKGDGGRNQLLLELGSHDRVRADLSRSRVTATRAGVEDSIRVRGFDDLVVTAKRADVIGTNRANRIGVIACRTTIKGTKGRDDLYVDSQYRGLGTWTTPRCATTGPRSTAALATTASLGASAVTASSAARARTGEGASGRARRVPGREAPGVREAHLTARDPRQPRVRPLGRALATRAGRPVGQLLERPAVAVGVGEEDEPAPLHLVDLAHRDAATRQLGAYGVGVRDHHLHVVERPGSMRVSPLPKAIEQAEPGGVIWTNRTSSLISWSWSVVKPTFS